MNPELENKIIDVFGLLAVISLVVIFAKMFYHL
jgi:hypothetical protein